MCSFGPKACKTGITKFALVWFFTSVYVDVISQSAEFTESFATIFTFVSPFTGWSVFLLHVERQFAFADHVTTHRTGNFVVDFVDVAFKQHGAPEDLVTFDTGYFLIAVHTDHMIG